MPWLILTVFHFAFLCYSATGKQVEARDLLRSLLQVAREYKIRKISDASVKLLIKMAVKYEQEEADVMNMSRTSFLTMTSFLPG